MRERLCGIFPPLPTIFSDSSGEVDVQATSANAADLMRTRLAGVLALGSNGEAASLDDDEGLRVIAGVREVVPATKLLIAGAGRESTRATIAACQRAGRAGADAVLIRPPVTYRAQMTTEALVAHYTAVADASPVPVLLYNLPASGLTLTLPVVARLADHGNIAGMKETSPDLERLGQFAALRGGTFPVLSGWAPVLLSAMAAGACGGILAVANVRPEACVTLFEHRRGGRHDAALEAQRALTPLARLVSSVYGVPGLKAAMDLVGQQGGPVRPPLQPASAGAREEIARALSLG
jgi:4-hydroxy-2-oxoglutarate aldolase